MDLNQLIFDLRQAQEDFENIKKTQKPIEDQLVLEEVPLVQKFIEKIAPFSKKKRIHGEDAILIYVFHSNGKTLISPEVYIKKNGDVVYEVYDEKEYRRFRPTALIEDGYNVIPLHEFLYACPLYEIIDYFRERADILYKDAEKLVEENKMRRNFVNKMKDILR